MEESQKLFSANGPLPRKPSPGREAKDAEGFSVSTSALEREGGGERGCHNATYRWHRGPRLGLRTKPSRVNLKED